METQLVIYRDKKKELRWRMKRNGRIVAESGEGYKRLRSLEKSLTNLLGDIRGDRSLAEDWVKDAIRDFTP